MILQDTGRQKYQKGTKGTPKEPRLQAFTPYQQVSKHMEAEHQHSFKKTQPTFLSGPFLAGFLSKMFLDFENVYGIPSFYP